MRATSVFLITNLLLIASASTVQAAYHKEGVQHIIKVSKSPKQASPNLIKGIQNTQKPLEEEEDHKQIKDADCNLWTC